MHGPKRDEFPDETPVSSFGADAEVTPERPVATSLSYLRETPPAGAETFEVAPGILWARVPLPFRLNHVNVWLIRETDGWTVIDTGTSDPAARAVWDQLLAGPLSGAPIVRLVATHGHTDHVGLAGWLSERSGGPPYLITLTEWVTAQLRIEEAKTPLSKNALDFLESHGCDPITTKSFAEDRRRTHRFMDPLPPAITRIRDNQTVRFGGRDWQVMTCGGHAPEHASFWCAEERILIAGDQVLSKISPMIGVMPQEPEANPLADYLASLDRFRALPADALVLPSHGLPFHGLHARVNQLADHHDQRLGALLDLMETPETAMTLAHGLFARAVADGQGRHAVAETLAHAHYLLATEQAERQFGSDGRIRFQRH
ncbi:MAG: MBL fold metallo-hydrolase [Proteobacteria bacterium]|nr:MBL fold metallo-hydrolase [Pseudomonadota bacterium]